MGVVFMESRDRTGISTDGAAQRPEQGEAR